MWEWGRVRELDCYDGYHIFLTHVELHYICYRADEEGRNQDISLWKYNSLTLFLERGRSWRRYETRRRRQTAILTYNFFLSWPYHAVLSSGSYIFNASASRLGATEPLPHRVPDSQSLRLTVSRPKTPDWRLTPARFREYDFMTPTRCSSGSVTYASLSSCLHSRKIRLCQGSVCNIYSEPCFFQGRFDTGLASQTRGCLARLDYSADCSPSLTDCRLWGRKTPIIIYFLDAHKL